VGIVDDLAHEDDTTVGELAARLVRILDGPVHAVAEAEALRQPEVEPPHVQSMAARLDEAHQRAAVLGLEERLDLVLEAEPAPEIGLFGAHAACPELWDARVPPDRGLARS